jgi:DNA mismatch repair protein MutS
LATVYFPDLEDHEGKVSLSWMDISTGQFCVSTFASTQLAVELARLSPSELIVTQDIATKLKTDLSPYTVTHQESALYEIDGASQRLCQVFAIPEIADLGEFTAEEISAAGTR